MATQKTTKRIRGTKRFSLKWQHRLKLAAKSPPKLPPKRRKKVPAQTVIVGTRDMNENVPPFSQRVLFIQRSIGPQYWHARQEFRLSCCRNETRLQAVLCTSIRMEIIKPFQYSYRPGRPSCRFLYFMSFVYKIMNKMNEIIISNIMYLVRVP